MMGLRGTGLNVDDAILDAVAGGELTPTETEALSRLVENFAKRLRFPI
jgi:hypothetical protein